MARPLNDGEKALWSRVIETVQPLHRTAPHKPPASIGQPDSPQPRADSLSSPKRLPDAAALPAKKSRSTAPERPPAPKVLNHNLDGHWDRRIGKGAIIPDVHVDLHGTALSGAYNRLDGALEQAIAQRARVLLLVTGKPRSHDRHSGEGRGAIASVVRDWLAASRHAGSIAAVRNAHPRHGGAGALYIILKR
ncbi:Smr/MutS family protein [Sphingorhabdus arenilitoris]|uniref:Smr/MutS family protein n=1 Tax=Sphingorhabdus arenilitoris TaxID=1490041 RepID=A0ABV8RHZ0_9SPHN